MDEFKPKYYAIDNWRQATNCISNIDSSLKIRYTQFVNSHILEVGEFRSSTPNSELYSQRSRLHLVHWLIMTLTLS